LAFVAAKNGSGAVTGLTQAKGVFRAGVLTLNCHNGTHCNMLEQGDNHTRLTRLVAEYFGSGASVELTFLEREPLKTQGAVQQELQAHPVVARVREAFEVNEPPIVYLRERR